MFGALIIGLGDYYRKLAANGPTAEGGPAFHGKEPANPGRMRFAIGTGAGTGRICRRPGFLSLPARPGGDSPAILPVSCYLPRKRHGQAKA